MQEVLGMHHLQRVKQRGDDGIEFLLCRQPAEAIEPGLEAVPMLEAHHHVCGGIGFEYARHSDYARVLEPSEIARFFQEVGATPVESLLVAIGLGLDAHGGVAIAEIKGVVFLDGDSGLEVYVLGLIGNAKPAGADHPHDAIAAIEHRTDWQIYAAVHDAFPRRARIQQCPIWSLPTNTRSAEER